MKLDSFGLVVFADHDDAATERLGVVVVVDKRY